MVHRDWLIKIGYTKNQVDLNDTDNLRVAKVDFALFNVRLQLEEWVAKQLVK